MKASVVSKSGKRCGQRLEMDPLSVLREFSIDNKLEQVVMDGTRVK